MDWIDWVFGFTCVVAGMGIAKAYDDWRYVMIPRPRHEWECQRCPTRLWSNDTDRLNTLVRKHMTNDHGVDL